MFRGMMRFVLLIVSTFFAPATGPVYWDFHAQMDRRSWDDEVSDEECDATIKSIGTHFAYTTFYILSGGSNSNAGSTNSATPIYSNTVAWVGGTGGAGNNQFVVVDAGASVIAVGDWINVGGTYVTQVTGTSNVGTTYTIVVSTTAAYGTEPATNASITAIDGGAWANFSQGLLTAATAIPGSTKIYSNLSYSPAGAVTLKLVGTTTARVWYQGYVTTPGDLEPGNAAWVAANNSSSATYPTITASAGAFSINANYTRFAGFQVSGSRAGAVMAVVTGTPVEIAYCRFQNTDATALGTALSLTTSTTCSHCWFKATATATNVVIVNSSSVCLLSDCQFFGGSASQLSSTNGAMHARRCTFNAPPTNGILFTSTGAGIYCDFCTFLNCGGAAIEYNPTAPLANGSFVANCYFYGSGGYNVLNNSGTATANMFFAYNCNNGATSGHASGFGDTVEVGATVAGAAAFNDGSAGSPDSTKFAAYASGNYQLAATSAGAGAALSQQQENLTSGLVSTPDCGAWQRAAGGAGGPVGQQCQ